MTLDRQYTWNLPFTLKTVEDCLKYIKDHYAEHQEESAMRITDFNIFHETMGPFTIKQNSDTVTISHDGDDAYIKWSDGNLTLQTDEGVNTATFVDIKGKGTGGGTVRVFDQDDAEYLSVWAAGQIGKLRMGGIAPGEIRIGGNTDYASFETDGEINLAGTARVWVCEDLEPNTVRLPGSNAPADDQKDNFAFHRYDRGTEESVFYHWHIPHDYATGDTNIRGHFEFLVENPPAVGDEAVVMGFEFKHLSPGDVFDFDAGTTSGTVTEVITDTEAAEIIHETALGTLATTGFLPGDTVLFRFYRDATNGADTYDNEAGPADNDVWVFNYHLEYLADKLGEASV
jgi:hypothetical protein